TLTGRAVLPAEVKETASQPAPAPFPKQPLGGFSALVDAPGGRGFYAMPDNGYGAKSNSADFLLRVYQVDPRLKTARGGAGDVRVLDTIQLSDPDGQVPFRIVTESTETRFLTGADFDIESMRIGADGTLWFGEEFGPFLLHTDARGKVLEAPIPLPKVKSPDNPYLGDRTANLPGSGGFEGMAISRDGRTLYPTLEKAIAGEPNADPLRRWINEFDVRERRYTGKRWAYRIEADATAIGDVTQLGDRSLLIIERDDAQGPAAALKKVFRVDLGRVDRDGYLVKTPVLDLLDIRDPRNISLPAREGDFGLGDPFRFPFSTIESVLPVGDGQLALVNDTNFGSTGRNATRPDDSEFIVVDVPGLRR
ncbi:MAG TPA: esterase-like activity of phytase family protein, partial [Solirubrobacteraceae bacterium]|nr:esterase-like activity of phytase family protein [Solirubrobacteraceae bacterium]